MSQLHIPVDSYIIEALWEENGVKIPPNDNFTEKFENHRKNGNKFSDYKVKSWSNWNKTDYEAFIESNKHNLKWENDAWIEIAEKRKGIKPKSD